MIDRTAFDVAVATAIRAPSLHNSQPWRFRLRSDSVEVVADADRTPARADPTGWGMRLGLGAATFNLRLGFAAAGHPMTVRWRPYPDQPNVVARLAPTSLRPATPLELRLFDAAAKWRSHRDPFSGEEVNANARVAMLTAAREEYAWLELLTGVRPVAIVAEIVQAAHRVLQRSDGYPEELGAWTRRDDADVDGVPAAVGGPSPEPQDLLPLRSFAQRQRAPGRDFEPEPLVGVLGTVGDQPYDQLVAGHALQRVLLTATDFGLRVSLFSQPIEVPSAREQLRLALRRPDVPQMVLRVGHGIAGGAKAPRRPIADVVDILTA